MELKHGHKIISTIDRDLKYQYEEMREASRRNQKQGSVNMRTIFDLFPFTNSIPFAVFEIVILENFMHMAIWNEIVKTNKLTGANYIKNQ